MNKKYIRKNMKFLANPKYSLDVENKAIIDNSNGVVISKEKVTFFRCIIKGYEVSNKNFMWYHVFNMLNIELPEKYISYVNFIEINNSYDRGNPYLTKYVVQTKEPIIYKHAMVEYALILRFGYLAISKDGVIINVNTNTIVKMPNLREVTNSKVYRYYYIGGREHIVHRLIAEAWIYNSDPKNKQQVNHIDGNKLNNVVSNLEWVTAKENIDHLFKNNLSEQNNITKIRHRITKEIKEFHSIKEMTKYLNISQQDFTKYPSGYLYNDYEIRVSNDTRPWYYINGDEEVISKASSIKIDLYKDNILIKTFFKLSDVKEYLNITYFPITVDYLKRVYNGIFNQYLIKVTNLTNVGPYDVKNINSGEIKRFDSIPQISKYIDYNESSIRVAINTDRLVKEIYAIKSSNENWKDNYKVILSTLAKEYELINVKTEEKIICKSFLEAVKTVNTSKKTLRKYINTNKEIFGYKINRV